MVLYHQIAMFRGLSFQIFEKVDQVFAMVAFTAKFTYECRP